jgi:hypothetical protein
MYNYSNKNISAARLRGSNRASGLYQELEGPQVIEFLISDFWILPPELHFVTERSTSSLDRPPIGREFFDKIVV